MGVVNYLIKFLGGKWQDLSIWLKEMKIVSQPYHGGQLKDLNDNLKDLNVKKFLRTF